VGGHNSPPIFISQKLKRMKNKLTKEEQRSNLEGSIIVYLLIWAALGVFMMLLFSSCSTQKVVYRVGDGWKQAAQKSEVTGWARTIK